MGDVQSKEGLNELRFAKHYWKDGKPTRDVLDAKVTKQISKDEKDAKSVKDRKDGKELKEVGNEVKELKGSKENSKEKDIHGGYKHVHYKLESSKKSVQEGLKKVDKKFKSKLKRKQKKLPIEMQQRKKSEELGPMGIGKRASRRTLEGYHERRTKILSSKDLSIAQRLQKREENLKNNENKNKDDNNSDNNITAVQRNKSESTAEKVDRFNLNLVSKVKRKKEKIKFEDSNDWIDEDNDNDADVEENDISPISYIASTSGYTTTLNPPFIGSYSSIPSTTVAYLTTNPNSNTNTNTNTNTSESDMTEDDLCSKDIVSIFEYLFTLSHDELYHVGNEVDKLMDGKFINTLVKVLNDLRAEKRAFGNSDDEYSDDDDGDDDHSPTRSIIPASSQCNWNDSFQQYVCDLKQFGHIQEERTNAFINLSNLALDFVHCAKMYGRIIITEVEMPIERKMIKPIDIGGIAGGDKYVVNNILFKFARDRHGLFDDEEAALKIAGHDLKGLIGYYNLGIEDLHFPLMALVDYLGYRLIAMSVLPIRKDTIIYGSQDAGMTMHNSSVTFIKKISLAGNLLNLKPHFAGTKRDNQVEVFSAADLEGHCVDGKYYLLDFSRTFPPTRFDPSIRNGNLYQLFRIEFVSKYHKPLSPDVYSGFTKYQNCEEDEAEIEEAQQSLLTRVIPDCAKLLDYRFVPYSNLKEVLHENGINLRYLGYLRNALINENIRKTVFIEMIGRVIKHLIRATLREKLKQTQVFLDHSIREVVVEKLNLIFGDSTESDRYFDDTIKPKLLRNFPHSLSNDEKQTPLKRLLQGPKDLNNLFAVVQEVCSLQFSESSKFEFTTSESAFLTSHPFHLSDLKRVAVRVRHMNIIALAMGYVLKNQARQLKSEGAITASDRLCKMAIEKFKNALSDHPNDKRALRGLADTTLMLGGPNADSIAEQYYLKALKIDDSDVNTMFKYAVFLEERERFKEAEEYYLRALEIDPFHDHCLQRYGYFLEASQANNDEAEEFFIRASEARIKNSTLKTTSANTPRQMQYLF